MKETPCCHKLSIWLPETFAKISAPALGERGQITHTMQKVLVRGICGIELNNVRDSNAVLIRSYQFNSITGRDFSFVRNGKVEPIATAMQESFDYFWPGKADAQFEARHTRLGNNKL